MIPWIVGAAVLVLAYLVYTASRGKGGPKAKPKVLETTIFVEPGPTVPDPDPLHGCPGDHLLWHIVNHTGAPVEVWIPNFTHKSKPGVRDPLEGPDNGRKNAPGQNEIRDVIKRGAEEGHYKYDIRVNGTLARDPDLEVIL